jgi:hypothetical protein
MMPPDRTARIRRETARLCLALGWTPLHEMPLPDGRRADILALCPDGRLVCIEIKSGVTDFLADRKWHAYRDFSDALYFAVDGDFPHAILPAEPGLIVACDIAEILREPQPHPIAPARRRMMLLRFAQVAGARLAGWEDPAGVSALRAMGRVE